MAYHSTIRERVLYSLVSLKEDEIIWLVRKIHTTRILERIMGILVTDIYSIGLLIGRNVCNWIILSREKCFWVWLVCGRMVSVSQPSQACEASLLTIRQFINCAFLEISVLPSVDSQSRIYDSACFGERKDLAFKDGERRRIDRGEIFRKG